MSFLSATGPVFLQTPGPTYSPADVLDVVGSQVPSHRSSDFQSAAVAAVRSLADWIGSPAGVAVFPSSGSGAAEAALVNCFKTGDTVLAFDTGHFAQRWTKIATRLGLRVKVLGGTWEQGPDIAALRDALARDRQRRLAGVMIVHNETSTGVETPVADARDALDQADHPALLLVDGVSSIGCTTYRHHDWGIDVTVGASQKGLMLPPGLGFNGVSRKALRVATTRSMANSYWNWADALEPFRSGKFPYTPPINLIRALGLVTDALLSEGMQGVEDRHRSFAVMVRRRVLDWGLSTVCVDGNRHSHSVTAVELPPDVDEVDVRASIEVASNIVLGAGLGKLAHRAFRIGHLGFINESFLAGVLDGIEMGLRASRLV